MAVSQAELAEKGALIHLQDLKAQIEELYTAYPGLLKAEQNAKRNATMMAKYGTLNPHKATENAGAAAATKTANAGPKKSHKKGAGKKAQAAAAGVAPTPSAAPAEAAAPVAETPVSEAVTETVMEISEQAEPTTV